MDLLSGEIQSSSLTIICYSGESHESNGIKEDSCEDVEYVESKLAVM